MITIRAARPADALAIAEVYLQSRKVHVAFAPLAHADDDTRQWIAHHLLPNSTVTVAEQDGAIVGMCATSHDGTVSWIDHLYVAPALVGSGIGAQLLQDALPRLQPPIRLYTFQANTGARRFYERHGFVPIQFGDGSENEEGAPDVLYERL